MFVFGHTHVCIRIYNFFFLGVRHCTQHMASTNTLFAPAPPAGASATVPPSSATAWQYAQARAARAWAALRASRAVNTAKSAASVSLTWGMVFVAVTWASAASLVCSRLFGALADAQTTANQQHTGSGGAPVSTTAITSNELAATGTLWFSCSLLIVMLLAFLFRWAANAFPNELCAWATPASTAGAAALL